MFSKIHYTVANHTSPSGEQGLVPRLKSGSPEEFMDHYQEEGQCITRGTMVCCLYTMRDALIEMMRNGTPIHLPSLGTFTLSLGGKVEVLGGKYVGSGVHVDGIRFTSDEELLKDLEASLDDDMALASLGIDPNNPLNFHVSEDLPQFPGGAVEFMKWLTKHLRYPNKARQENVQGRVLAVFYVEKDGHISGVRVTKSLSAECDREVMRVLNMMPKWKPGIQNDRPCRTKVCIPVVFRL